MLVGCNRVPHLYLTPWQKTALLFCVGLAIVGCDDGRPQRVPVSGAVMIDGQPLDYGFVRFIPEKGRLATGRLDDQGRFTLTTYEKGDGVAPGTHRVEIVAEEPLSETRSRWHAPKKYAHWRASGLTETIEGPTDDLRIDITWGSGAPFVENHH